MHPSIAGSSRWVRGGEGVPAVRAGQPSAWRRADFGAKRGGEKED